jgi:hypothetical protein
MKHRNSLLLFMKILIEIFIVCLTMSSSLSPHIAGEPAPSSGGTKQDPRAESDTHIIVDPNKKVFDALGNHEHDHEDAPGLGSREENENSDEPFNINAGDAQTHHPVISFFPFLSPSRRTFFRQAPKDMSDVSERLDLHNSFEAGAGPRPLENIFEAEDASIHFKNYKKEAKESLFE